ncbi:hypothetical protein [Shimia sp. MMG029]|uniref:hypothetical protein n=1 Tax=Shimia sp. MMG029 TaxID=3021978 RepID=UPI0022FE7CD9|nr:hypothetical protein [Shimia sp. MMG029]MDA5558834.1 hypothetical protein [Shimia sp. MMG029]
MRPFSVNMPMLLRIFQSLREGSEFSGDWYGWVTNQAGHSYFVGLPFAIIGSLLDASWIVTASASFIIYFVLWELSTKSRVNLRDSLTDTTHVSLGSALLVSLSNQQLEITVALLVLQFLMLLSGISRRMDGRI